MRDGRGDNLRKEGGRALWRLKRELQLCRGHDRRTNKQGYVGMRQDRDRSRVAWQV